MKHLRNVMAAFSLLLLGVQPSRAAVVQTAIDGLTLTNNGDGTKTLTYEFSITQAFAPAEDRSVTPDVWFVEDDTVTCDDNIATKPAPTLTIRAGQTMSNRVSVSHTFNPLAVEDDTEIEFHVEVHAKDGLSGTGDGIFDNPAQDGTGDPPPGSEPEDFCDPAVHGEPETPYEGTTATVSVVLGSTLAVDPVDMPRLADVAPAYERLDACLVEESGFVIQCQTMKTNGNVPGIEEIGIGDQDVSGQGHPAMTVVDISGIPNFRSRVDRVEISAVDAQLIEPPLLIMVADLEFPPQLGSRCLKWVAFCDGIQIDSVAGGQIDAQWYHYDCANNTDMTRGAVRSVPNGCPGGGGNAGIACLVSDTCGQLVGGSTWTFIIDMLDGTLDMNNGLPQTCWIDELAYTLTIGACTGLESEGQKTASWQ